MRDCDNYREDVTPGAAVTIVEDLRRESKVRPQKKRTKARHERRKYEAGQNASRSVRPAVHKPLPSCPPLLSRQAHSRRCIMATTVALQRIVADHILCLTDAATLCALQKGSQFRSKAEPAGAVKGDTWVPGTNFTKTLQEAPSGPYCRNIDEAPPLEQPKA